MLAAGGGGGRTTRKAIWIDDISIKSCTKCRVLFDLIHLKHHCR